MPVTWVAECRLEGDPDHSWRECRVHDLSPRGAGFEVAGLDDVELAHGSTVEIRLVLVGSLRHARPEDSGSTKVGVEIDYVTGVSQASPTSTGEWLPALSLPGMEEAATVTAVSGADLLSSIIRAGVAPSSELDVAL